MVVAFQRSLSPPAEHEVRPAPVMVEAMLKVVVVAFVVVALRAVKSWKVEEAETKRLVLVALVVERLSAVTSPVLSIEKSVEVANEAVDEEIKKSVVGGMAAPEVVVEFAWMEKNASGEVVPIPTRDANVLFAVVEVATM